MRFNSNQNRTKFISNLIILLFSFFSGVSLAKYENSNPSIGLKSLSDVIKWRIDAPPAPERVQIELSSEWQDKDFAADDYAVWIGHSTFLIKHKNLTVLTDPVFSKRASPFSWIGPKRLIPPAIPMAELPKVDVILISHNHYDHLDIKSIKKIQARNSSLQVFVPKGDMRLLKKRGIRNVFEFGWWDSKPLDSVDFIFTPAQHWSGRGVFDRNKSWWGGWLIKTKLKSIFHAGDTGYSQDFLKIRSKFGPIDVAFLPIGAFEPRWFMSGQHVDPTEALKIAADLEVTKAYGMHWGTFILTDEAVLEPRKQLIKLQTPAINPARPIFTPKPGEWLDLSN